LPKRIEHFFSSAVTHVITNRPQPPKNEQYDPSNKENATPRPPPTKGNVLKSPIQLKGRCVLWDILDYVPLRPNSSAHDHGNYDKLVRDAVQLDKKIWSISSMRSLPLIHFSFTNIWLELDNILSRLVPSTATSSKAKNGPQSTQLTQLLQHERLHGTTSERDPRERRHDFQYFSKQSHFLLVEDIWGELAPIAIMEYPASSRTVEKDKAPAYPVLYMDPRARSPFVKFDDREARKQQKIENNEAMREKEKEKNHAKVKEQLKHQHEETQRKTKSLRRCASMSQLGRRAVTRAELGDLESEGSGSGVGLSNSLGLVGDRAAHQQIASGFGPSTTGLGTGNGYLAASGNSVAITSTTTTSYARALGSSRLPPNLREQLGRQVVTSRRLEGAGGKENANPFMAESRLRKAKSTTTMRLPAREESKKPGYCEACRVKFEDFKEVRRGSFVQSFSSCLLMSVCALAYPRVAASQVRPE
jgi:regulatory subunit for Cdc7p protein kinase